MNKQLTKHFNLDEFTRTTMTDDHDNDFSTLTADASTMTDDHDDDSSTLTADNDHDCEVIENLRNLCTEVLEPLREHFGVPVIVSSGYRSAKLNKLVGGVKNSQHMTGEAADVVCSNMTNDHDHDSTMTADSDLKSAGQRSSSSSKVRVNSLREWFLFIQDNCCFDQLILETKKGRSWIHVSCCRDKSRNRQTSFTMKR